ncbi:MAG: SpoIIE family protein phosphatase [Terracidiphilus sp.]
MISRVFKALIFLQLLVCAASALAQGAAPDAGRADPRHVDATSFGDLVGLGPDWLFAPGDNPAWASPALDDSGWKTISTEKPLTEYGYRDLHFAWYRMHIRLRPGTRNLMVGTSDIAGNYEVYANGVRLGGSGKMTERLLSSQHSLVSYAIPDNLAGERGDLVLAIRCAVNWGSSSGHGASTPLYSDSVLLLGQESAPLIASFAAAHIGGPELLLGILALLAGMISFALYFALRSQQEYLAIGIYLLADSVMMALQLWLYVGTFSFSVHYLDFVVLSVLTIAGIEFVRLVLHLPRTRWLLAMEVVCSLVFLLTPLNTLGIISNTLNSVFFVPILMMKVVLPALLIRGRLKGNREAGLLLPAILIGSLADYWYFLRNLAYFTHLNALIPYFPFSVSLGSYQVNFYRVGDFFFDIFILIFLVQRTVRIARERNRVAAELEAARTVQQILIPDEVPAIPGFVLQSVYKPAGQVGGDFFQILPLQNGGVLLVIGDVSGKGLPAAMTVSLLVGTVRTLAHYTESPSEILAAMNQRMLTRSNGGFTTCLVLRADRDGKLTIANAGHLSPYLGGKELPLENGLPLGLSAATVYVESTFQQPPEEQLTLLTDGVVEARDKAGALFGFDRTAAVSVQSAEAIAEVAQSFGQEDDITALTLTRTA